MSEKILVTYASRFGSTAGVAEAIGKTLTELGVQVDVLPMKEVKDISPYQSVVAGSAINGNAWLPEAMQFLQTYQAELQRKLVSTPIPADPRQLADRLRARTSG